MALSHSQLHPDTLFSFLVSQTNSSSHSSAFSISCAVSYCSFCGANYPAADFLWLRVHISRHFSKVKLQDFAVRSDMLFQTQGSSVKLLLPASNKLRNNFTEMKNFSLPSCKTWVQTKIRIRSQAEVFPQVPQISVKHNLHPNFQLWREASLTSLSVLHKLFFHNYLPTAHRSRNKCSHVVGCWQETSNRTYSWRD